MLKDCIVNIPDHKFPMSYFDVPELGKPFVSPAKTETKNASKKFKSTLAVDQTINNSTIRPKKKTLSKSSNSVDTAVFREIDTDLVVLIRVSSFKNILKCFFNWFFSIHYFFLMITFPKVSLKSLLLL